MTGIELMIGDDTIKAALEDGVVSLLIDGSSERRSLYFGGLDRKNGKLVEWLSGELMEGDKLNIHILDVAKEEVSNYQKIKEMDDLLLFKYKRLKQKLERKGLI